MKQKEEQISKPKNDVFSQLLVVLNSHENDILALVMTSLIFS